MVLKRCWILLIALLISASGWAQSIFDMPRLFPQHREYLRQFINAAQKGNLFDAEVAARSAVKLFPRDANWSYNVACICAKDNRPEEALQWLERAVQLGFTNTTQILQDADLKSLNDNEKFKALIDVAKALAAHPPKNPTLSRALSTPVPMGQSAMVEAQNTQWDWDPRAGGYFQTLFQPLKPKGDAPAYTGLYADLIQPWIEAKTAAGNAGDLYVNRDEDRTQIPFEKYPQLTPVLYSEEAQRAKVHLGSANGIFQSDIFILPTVGNSVLPLRQGSPFWRSIPRMHSVDPVQNAVALRMALSNQLYLYDVTPDYNKDFKGDLLISNTPQVIMTADTTSNPYNPVEAQTQMTELVLAAMAAMEPETKAEMLRRRLLVPTMQRLFRQHLKGAPAYLSAAAHPLVFDPQMIDGEALIRGAHALTMKDLPPQFHILARRETMPRAMVDYFDLVPTEGIADTPMCITRIHRGMNRTRTLTVEAASSEPGLRYQWFLVSGEQEKVRILPLTSTGSLVTLSVDYHGLFEREGMPTRRVDIACIAMRADGTPSAPAFVSIRYLANEQRTYHISGKIDTVDYTDPESGYLYEDPLLTAFKHWTDTYHYDAEGNVTGWTRKRSDGTPDQDFTARGERIVERDEQGRPKTLVKVSYLPRTIPDGNGVTSPFMELIQNDDGEPFPAKLN